MMRFDAFEFDAARRYLSRDGQALHLTPKAFDLLALLIDSSPTVVSKRELHARLWPKQAVSDATLTGLIKELRRALGDTASERRMVRTVHRVGYALDAEVQSDELPTRGLLTIGRRRALLIHGGNLIGRDPGCDIWIDDATVSRKHARILVSVDRIALEDLGSKNGTIVEDAAVDAPRELHDGDRIRFGKVEAVFRDSPARQATVTQLSVAD
jgi:DNA-binding winged helix-turn-helix (wHTH) protein